MQHGSVEGELHEGVLQQDQAGGERKHVAGIDVEGVKGVEKSVQNSEDSREKTHLYDMNYLL